MPRLTRAVLVLLALVPRTAAAAPDYDPQSSDWNGLSELVTLAESEGIELRVVKDLDAEALDPIDGLLVIYPRRPLPSASLVEFLRRGGRLALADDFGEGQGLLRRFGIERIPAPTGTA
ncbi:MAG: DUF4350 domain-containing protein, partial [Polyangiaceae bacterium]|nr:DUF4350 domain-containing protein [Polyangiaceae bacterium]